LPAPQALALEVVWCGTDALRLFHITPPPLRGGAARAPGQSRRGGWESDTLSNERSM